MLLTAPRQSDHACKPHRFYHRLGVESERFIKRGKSDRAARFSGALDLNGEDAVRLGVVDRAYQAALRNRSDCIVFSPARFASGIEKLDGPARQVITRAQYLRLRGFANLTQHVKRAGEYEENPPTDKRLLLSFLDARPLLGFGGAALVSLLLTSKASTRFRTAASRFETESP